MNIIDLAFAVFIGNLLTACFLWACFQFHKHDEQASWLAYFAFLFPICMALVTLYITGTVPPHLDALVAQ